MDRKMIVGVCMILFGTLLLIMSISEWMCRSESVNGSEIVQENLKTAGNKGS